MKLYKFTVGPFEENTYVLISEKKALVVDPGFHKSSEFNEFSRKLDEENASLKAVILTHAHVDHVLGLQSVLDDFSVPVYLNDTDRYLWDNFASQAQMFGIAAKQFDFEPEKLPVQKNWEIEPFCFDVLYTPGHAPDHVSFYNAEDQMLIAGDVIFREGVGRTDLYRGDMKILQNSIREQLYSLPDETKVYPGHGSSTTIGHEKKRNPFVHG